MNSARSGKNTRHSLAFSRCLSLIRIYFRFISSQGTLIVYFLNIMNWVLNDTLSDLNEGTKLPNLMQPCIRDCNLITEVQARTKVWRFIISLRHSIPQGKMLKLSFYSCHIVLRIVSSNLPNSKSPDFIKLVKLITQLHSV